MTFATEVATSELTDVLAREAKVDAKTDTRPDTKTRRVPALKTARLSLRAPSHGDVATMVFWPATAASPRTPRVSRIPIALRMP